MRKVGWYGAGLLCMALAGCAADQQVTAELDAGYSALDQKQYDQALARADAVLSAVQGSGRGAADALYLRGRALEDRSKPDAAAAAADLDQARHAYTDALAQNPELKLEARIRASLANVAFFQDDYQTAYQEYKLASETLEKAEDKGWALYRVGLSQQRLSQWAAADETFAEVERDYPDSVPAERARQHQGASAFYVQVATFSSEARAISVVNDLRRQGVSVMQSPDPSGAARHYVRAGPVAKYGEAQRLKARLAGAYPDALIVP